MSGTPPDLEINCAVRRVFVRHWVDLGKLSFRSQKGRVTVRGSLDRLPGSDQPLTVQAVEQLFVELQRIHGVDRVIAELSNWERTSMGWKNTRGQVEQSSGRTDLAPQPGTTRTFVITRKVEAKTG